jgi:hypothetical protein
LLEFENEDLKEEFKLENERNTARIKVLQEELSATQNDFHEVQSGTHPSLRHLCVT